MNLYILPFDHRSTFVKGIFGFSYPLTARQKRLVELYKEIVFQGFVRACGQYQGPAKKEEFAIFIDEEFGKPVMAKAKKLKVPFATAVEESGKSVFNFAYGKEFGKHILKTRPRFAKALVRYLPGNSRENSEQRVRLKQFVQFCRRNRIATIVEVLIQKSGVFHTSESSNNFEKFARPRLTAKAIREFEKAGVCPTIWKLELQDTAAAWKKIIRAANEIPIVVLGGGESQDQIEFHLRLAAKFPEIIGFAIGRTVFLEVLKDLFAKKITKHQAVHTISEHFLGMIQIWENERKK